MNQETTMKKAGRAIKDSPLLSVVLIIVGFVVVMEITMQMGFGKSYLTPDNVFMLFKVFSITALIGMSQMIIIASGGMNLSVGETGALCAIMAGAVMDAGGMPPIMGILVGIGVGVLCGVANGLLIYRAGGVGVAFFLTTLATSSVFKGINLTYTQGTPFYGIPKSFINIGNTSVGSATGFHIPTSFFIMLAVAILLAFLFSKMKIGRQILAFGANHKSAELYGVSKIKVVVLSNIIASVIAAVAGLLVVMRIEAAQPNIGEDWMLQSFAGPLIGGTRLAGGKVNVTGAILGGVVLTLITNALTHLKVDVYWNMLIYGIMIMVAVTIDRLRYRKRDQEEA